MGKGRNMMGDYSDERVLQVLNLTNEVVTAVMGVDGVGPISMLREIGAIKTFFNRARQTYADSPLIQAMLRMSESEAYAQEGTKTTAVDAEDVLTRVGGIDVLVDDPAEAALLKRFLYELAAEVANASGPGWFGSGERMSAQEKIFLERLKTRLGLA